MVQMQKEQLNRQTPVMPAPLPQPGIQRQLEDIINRPALHIGISSGVLRRFWMLFYALCGIFWVFATVLVTLFGSTFLPDLINCIQKHYYSGLHADTGELLIAYLIFQPLSILCWIGSRRSYLHHASWGTYRAPMRMRTSFLLQGGSLLLLSYAIGIAQYEYTFSHAHAEEFVPCNFRPELQLSLCAVGIILLQTLRYLPHKHHLFGRKKH